VQCCP